MSLHVRLTGILGRTLHGCGADLIALDLSHHASESLQ